MLSNTIDKNTENIYSKIETNKETAGCAIIHISAKYKHILAYDNIHKQ
jgi:hypothetical protein